MTLNMIDRKKSLIVIIMYIDRTSNNNYHIDNIEIEIHVSIYNENVTVCLNHWKSRTPTARTSYCLKNCFCLVTTKYMCVSL